jgi:argininosuccinate lyase
MLQTSRNSYAISFDLAELLAAKNGISFRMAHKMIGSLVQKAIGNNRQPLRMLREEDIREVLQRFGSNLQADDVLRDIRQTTPEKSITSRQSAGSPNPTQERETVNLLRRRLSVYAERIAKRKRHVGKSLENLLKMVNNYSN